MIYKFYWGRNEEQLIEIVSSDVVAVEPEHIGILLDQYRKRAERADNEYNIDGWCKYLEHCGYAVRRFDPDYSMYF